MNYQELDDLVSKLQESVENNDPQKGYWRELWSLVKQISGGFKETRYPTLEAKNEAWGRFNELREKASTRSQEDRQRVAKQQQEWEERKQKSERFSSKIQAKSGQARPFSGIERALGTIILAPILVLEAILRDILGLEQLDRIKEELLNCNAQMQEARRLFAQYKSEMLPGDKAQTHQALVAAQEKLDRAWAEWKGRMDLFYQQKRENYERKQREFTSHVRAHIATLEEKLEKAQGALARQEAHLEKLQDDYNNAWSDNFKERCSGWIEECETRISDIQESISRIESWLDEERGKLK
jgi:hypothetical protein